MTRIVRWRAVLVSCALGVSSTLPLEGRAAAELPEARDRVVGAWLGSGATLITVGVRFLFDDETVSLAIPPSAGLPCVRVAVIGARGASLRACASAVLSTSRTPV